MNVALLFHNRPTTLSLLTTPTLPCLPMYMHTQKHTHTCTHMYTHTHIYAHTHMYTHIHKHTASMCTRRPGIGGSKIVGGGGIGREGNWASESSPTLGCSIEISRDIYIYIYVGMSYVCRMSN